MIETETNSSQFAKLLDQLLEGLERAESDPGATNRRENLAYALGWACKSIKAYYGDDLRCSVCGRHALRLSGDVLGCAVHGIRKLV